MADYSRDKILAAKDAAQAQGDTKAVAELSSYLEALDERTRVLEKMQAPGARPDVANASAINPGGAEMLEAVKGAGVRGGAQMVGTAIGAAPPLVAITGGLSPRLGGAGGAVLGELIEGVRTGNHPTGGQLMGAAGAGFLLSPNSQVVNRGAALTKTAIAPPIPQELLKGTLKEAGGNMAAVNIESLYDEGKLASVDSQALAGFAGAAGHVTGKALNRGKRATLTQEEMLTARAAVRTIDDALTDGYKLDPSLANPTPTNRALTHAVGRSNLQNSLSQENIKLATRHAAAEIGMDPRTATLSWEAVKDQRDAIAAPYRNAAALSPEAKDAFEGMQDARSNWRETLKQASREPDYSKKKQLNEEAQKHFENAKDAEKALELEAAAKGNPGMVEEIVNARKLLAKWYVVDAALNADNGMIDPRIIAAIHDKNRDLLTGKLRTIGATANAFPQIMAPIEQSANVVEHGIRGLYITAAATAGNRYGGALGGFMAGGAMAASDVPLKAFIKNPWWQAVMAHPSYDLKSPDKVADFYRYAVDAYGRNPPEVAKQDKK
jgi:hypothetical protein